MGDPVVSTAGPELILSEAQTGPSVPARAQEKSNFKGQVAGRFLELVLTICIISEERPGHPALIPNQGGASESPLVLLTHQVWWPTPAASACWLAYRL